jgi:hypothetical protein
LDSYQAKIEASLEDLNIRMDISLEKTKAWIETGQDSREAKIKPDLEELKAAE